MAIRLLFLFSILTSTISSATEFVIRDHCDGSVVLKTRVYADGETIGDLSERILNRFNIRHEIEDGSIKSINNSPKGNQAIDFFSSTHMRTYGWCYSVDGVVYLKTLAREFQLTGQENNVTWYFGYADYKDGKWISMCAFNRGFKNPTTCRN